MASSTVPVQTTPGEIGELGATSTSGGGTALNAATGAVFITIPDGTAHIMMIPRNLASGAVVAQVYVNPYLFVLKTQDNLATDTDYSQAAQESGSTLQVVLDAMDTLANGDYLLIGSHIPFRGINVTIGSANANASTLTVTYWNGTTWANITATDGTASGGASLAVSGNVTWTVPSTWTLATIAQTGLLPSSSINDTQSLLYWTRWQWSAVLSATVRANAMLAMNRQKVSAAELLPGQVFEQVVNKQWKGAGCIEANVNAGTGNLIVNVASRYGTGLQSA